MISNDAYPPIHEPVEYAATSDLRATLEALVVFPFELVRAAIPLLRGRSACPAVIGFLPPVRSSV